MKLRVYSHTHPPFTPFIRLPLSMPGSIHNVNFAWGQTVWRMTEPLVHSARVRGATYAVHVWMSHYAYLLYTMPLCNTPQSN